MADEQTSFADFVKQDADIEIEFVDLEPSSDEDEAGEHEPQTTSTTAAAPDYSLRWAELGKAERHNHERRALHRTLDLEAFQAAPSAETNIAYLRYSDLRPEAFRAQHHDRPVMITGVPEADAWPAATTWRSPEALKAAHGHVPFIFLQVAPVSGMGKPMAIELPLSEYIDYAGRTTADSPFYLFQKEFGPAHDELFADYSVPSLFRDDLYDCEELRSMFPRFRYFVIGGPRTGSALHVDPNYTSAWNTLLCGTKRWVLFPPVPPGAGDGGAAPDLSGSAYLKELGVQVDSAAGLGGYLRQAPGEWWLDVYPRVRQRWRELGMIEAVQRPGDTIYVPYGWWHGVLNLDFAAAITQNLLMEEGLTPGVVREIRQRTPYFLDMLRDAWASKRPALLERIGEKSEGEGKEEEEEGEGEEDGDGRGSKSARGGARGGVGQIAEGLEGLAVDKVLRG